MQKHFTYNANAKLSRNDFEIPEENVESPISSPKVLKDLNFLTIMNAVVECEGIVRNTLVYLDFSNEQVFDFNFKIINDTNLGRQILERIKSQRTAKENLAKVPFEIIQKAMKVREEKEKMQQGGYYGEN